MPEVIFVCWGNICRSAMAMFVAERWAEEAGVSARFTSAGVSSEEHGNPVYPPAQRVLAAHGYRSAGHRAHRITRSEIEAADLVIGMEQIHLNRMRQIAPDADNLHLLSEYDPDAFPGQGVPDPWGGPISEFEDTLAAIEAAMPAILAEVRELSQ
jgi:protein-tyrosine phosphatase